MFFHLERCEFYPKKLAPRLYGIGAHTSKETKYLECSCVLWWHHDSSTFMKRHKNLSRLELNNPKDPILAVTWLLEGAQFAQFRHNDYEQVHPPKKTVGMTLLDNRPTLIYFSADLPGESLLSWVLLGFPCVALNPCPVYINEKVQKSDQYVVEQRKFHLSYYTIASIVKWEARHQFCGQLSRIQVVLPNKITEPPDVPLAVMILSTSSCRSANTKLWIFSIALHTEDPKCMFGVACASMITSKFSKLHFYHLKGRWKVPYFYHLKARCKVPSVFNKLIHFTLFFAFSGC